MIVYGRTHTYYAESCILSAKCEMLKYLDFKMINSPPPPQDLVITPQVSGTPQLRPNV